MPAQPRKMSEIMKEMAETLLRDASALPSSEAVHVALLFANVAWNECVGMDHAREGYRKTWETMEASNPALWNEFKLNDIDAMIEGLVQYKQKHYPDDRRRILVCGMVEVGNVHVEWLDPAAPGVDCKWEMRRWTSSCWREIIVAHADPGKPAWVFGMPHGHAVPHPREIPEPALKISRRPDWAFSGGTIFMVSGAATRHEDYFNRIHGHDFVGPGLPYGRKGCLMWRRRDVQQFAQAASCLPGPRLSAGRSRNLAAAYRRLRGHRLHEVPAAWERRESAMRTGGFPWRAAGLRAWLLAEAS
jgi:hypothetical protein